MVNALAAQARVFHGIAMLRRNNEPNQVSPSLHAHVVSWGEYNSTRAIFTKRTQQTKCIVREGVICEGCFTHSSSLCCCCDPPCSRLCYLFRKSADYGRFFHASLYFPCYLQGSGMDWMSEAISGSDGCAHAGYSQPKNAPPLT